ncbi:MAG: fumarylacetoacetate hydrolase family protein [Thaumarchaeota archaeon]|nr:fumarylacetoacetate hydrolase family protein [Nitrososphaerota archaeon]
MKLANYEKDGFVRAGLVKGDQVFDIFVGSNKENVPSVDQILDGGLLDVVRGSEAALTGGMGTPLSSARLRSPVMYPEKIIMVGVNYWGHSKEENIKPPENPYLFTKFRNALIGPGEPIIVPKVSQRVDWEVELTVVIGKKGKDISKNDAYAHVAGYTVSNDVSMRDFQKKASVGLGLNWVKGKGMDGTFPLGPWLVTRDEIPDPHTLGISLAVNGEQKQSSNTADMIFKVDDLVSYASIGTTLQPGDVISTGTPGGVAEGSGSPFLKQGDVVEARIDRIGTLRNPVEAER